jgi:hypothetical protein
VGVHCFWEKGTQKEDWHSLVVSHFFFLQLLFAMIFQSNSKHELSLHLATRIICSFLDVFMEVSSDWMGEVAYFYTFFTVAI